MGAGSAGSNDTMAFRGTVPVTSDVVDGAGGVDAVDACGVFDPHATVRAAANMRKVNIRMNFGW